MVDEARPYAIHSDSECNRLEKQAVLAGLENHLRYVPVPKTARILDAGCGSGAMARCFASHFAEASVIGVDIRDDYVVYAQGRAKEDGLQNVYSTLFRSWAGPQWLTAAFGEQRTFAAEARGPHSARLRPTAVLAAVVNLHCNKRVDAYSITSSARSWSAVDRSTPIALAVLRLITSSNFTGC
jgi:SAM-dependent methyltransferase